MVTTKWKSSLFCLYGSFKSKYLTTLKDKILLSPFRQKRSCSPNVIWHSFGFYDIIFLSPSLFFLHVFQALFFQCKICYFMWNMTITLFQHVLFHVLFHTSKTDNIWRTTYSPPTCVIVHKNVNMYIKYLYCKLTLILTMKQPFTSITNFYSIDQFLTTNGLQTYSCTALTDIFTVIEKQQIILF